MLLKVLFAANILLKTIDIVTTNYLVHMRGSTIEANPVVKNMILTYGDTATYSVTFIIFMLLMTLLYKFNQPGLLAASAVIMLAVAINNLVVVFY
jgi:hypothetical protein